MLNTLREHAGKTAAVTGGGFSLAAALFIFATKSELDMVKTRQQEAWRQLQDVRLILMRRSDLTETNGIATVHQ